MDLDRITKPLRLVKGSHQPGSGKGSATRELHIVAAAAGKTVRTRSKVEHATKSAVDFVHQARRYLPD